MMNHNKKIWLYKPKRVGSFEGAINIYILFIIIIISDNKIIITINILFYYNWIL